MQNDNQFIVFIRQHIASLETKIIKNLNSWKIKPQDTNWVKGSAKGIFGKMFEIMFEYIITIKRMINEPKYDEMLILRRFINKYSGFYNKVVPNKQKTFQNVEELKNEPSCENLFDHFVIMIFEISFWYFYDINLDPSSKSSLKHGKEPVHQGLRDSVRKTFKDVRNGLRTDLEIAHSVKDFFFKFFEIHSEIFADLINPKLAVKFNWNYWTWNRQKNITNPIHEFDISVFEVDEKGRLKNLIHVYELKYSDRRPMEQIQNVKRNSTNGPIKIYLAFTDEEFKAKTINPIYTILVFTTGEVITI